MAQNQDDEFKNKIAEGALAHWRGETQAGRSQRGPRIAYGTSPGPSEGLPGPPGPDDVETSGADSERGEDTDRVIAERYHLHNLVGEGGFGKVYRARDLHLDRWVALKVQRSDPKRLDRDGARLYLESEVLGRLHLAQLPTVHQRGLFEDGRRFYVMALIGGKTWHEVIEELHAASTADAWGKSAQGIGLRKLLADLATIARALHRVHQEGYAHCDIKPSNIKANGRDVYVLDWGLLCKVNPTGEGASQAAVLLAAATESTSTFGTASYMPPEQAWGVSAAIGPWSDQYALGAILYTILMGFAPYEDLVSADLPARARQTQIQQLLLLKKQPTPIGALAAAHPVVDEELIKICDRSMAWRPDERYADIDRLAEDIDNYLDGVLRAEQVDIRLKQAELIWQEMHQLRLQATETRKKANEMLVEVRFEPVEHKKAAWIVAEQADALDTQAAQLEAQWLRSVYQTLQLLPKSSRVAEHLAQYYRFRLIDDERRNDRLAATVSGALYEEYLRQSGGNMDDDFVKNRGRISLQTVPSDLTLDLHRFEEIDQRLLPAYKQAMAAGAVEHISLEAGSYRFEATHNGKKLYYPFLIQRGETWVNTRPGAARPQPIRIDLLSQLKTGEILIPAGWFWAAGDEYAVDCGPQLHVWVDDFAIMEHPVTTGQYLEFLNAFVEKVRQKQHEAAKEEAAGRLDLAKKLREEAQDLLAKVESHTPRRQPSEGTVAQWLFVRGSDGLLRLPERLSLGWQLDWPIAMVTWWDAIAYAQWKSAETGLLYRLPHSLEWEKAARGVDRRKYPWGDGFDESWTVMVSTTKDPPLLRPISACPPADRSPYEVCSMGGNIRDWCGNIWQHNGDQIDEAVLQITNYDMVDQDHERVVCGGAFTATAHLCRSASRFGNLPFARHPSIGFRLVRSVE